MKKNGAMGINRRTRGLLRSRTVGLLTVWILVLTCRIGARAQPPLRDFAEHLDRIHREFQAAQQRADHDTTNVDVAWKLGRAAFDWADFATNDQQRSTIAEIGAAACRRAARLDSNSAPAHYYLGLNLGQLARTKMLGALKLIDEMEREWTTAIQLDPKFDYGGPHRAIGVLYRDAPGWPTSIGSEKKSRHHLTKAMELHPEYPGNRLSYYEGLLQWGDKRIIRQKAEETNEWLKKARTIFTGEQWALDWTDWDRRWEDIRRKAGVKDTGR